MAGRGRSKSTLGFHHEPAGGKEKSMLDKGEKGERSFWKEQVLGAGVRAASTANVGRYVSTRAAPVFPAHAPCASVPAVCPHLHLFPGHYF
jgi:hypothetical protein